MFAPVVSRFQTYNIALDDTTATYCAAIQAMPAMRQWLDEAAAETEVIATAEFLPNLGDRDEFHRDLVLVEQSDLAVVARRPRMQQVGADPVEGASLMDQPALDVAGIQHPAVVRMP